MNKSSQILNSDCPLNNSSQGNSLRLVFVCSLGMLRSPTAQLVATEKGYNSRSCGSDLEKSLIPINKNLILWADYLFFMELKNYKETLDNFPELKDVMESKKVILNLCDEYDYNDEFFKKHLSLKLENFNL
jgi:predicted protein tyrosine phosphatase